MPALIIVAFSVPTPGTSRSSTRLPVGNIEPPAPSSSAAGSMNSSCTSAAGKVTPSSSKSPVSCTAPSVIGTCAMMVLPMLACQMRTVATPSSRHAARIDQAVADRERPHGRGEIAAVAAPVDEGLVDGRPDRTGSRRRDRAGCSSRGSPSCWCSTSRRPCRRSACRTDRGCRSRAAAARRARRPALGPLRADPAGGRTRLCSCRRACRWRES